MVLYAEVCIRTKKNGKGDARMRAGLRTRTTVIFASIAAALLILSGCVSMEMESEFNEDGGATHSMALTIDQGDFAELGDLGGEGELDPFSDFDEMEEQAAAEGFRVERIEDGDIVGVRLIYDVDDSSDLGEQLNRMFNTGAAEGEEVSPFSGTFEKDGDDYTIDLVVDGTALTDTAGDDLGDTEDLGLSLDTIFDFSYSARLPGEIDEEETNGRIASDGTITWDLPLDGTETLTAVSSTGGDGVNVLLILIVVGIIVLGLIALAAVAFFVLMNRRGSDPAVATAGAPAPPPPPSASTYGADQPTQPSMPTVQDPQDPPQRNDPPPQA